MDNTKQRSSEENPVENVSVASLDRAFVLSSNESLLSNDADCTKTTTDKSLLGEDTDSMQITNTDNECSDSTSYLAFPDACGICNKSVTEGPTVCPGTHVSDSIDESCSRISSGEPHTEYDPENVKNKTLSKVLAYMIQTILKGGSKESKKTETVVTSSSSERVPDKLGSNICRSPRKTKSYFSPSLEIAASAHAVNDREDSCNIDASSKLITILEGTNEFDSNLSNENLPNWSRMNLGIIRSFTPALNNDVTCNTGKCKTYVKNESVNGFTSSDVDTSLSFGRPDDYFDTIDSSIHEHLEVSGSEYASASELSSTEETSREITSDVIQSTWDDSNAEEPMASKISFGLVKNGNPQTFFNSPGLKSRLPKQSVLIPRKKKERLPPSLTDVSVNVTPYDVSDKDNTCAPIRRTKAYALPKTPQRKECAKKINPKNGVSSNNSPRSPGVVTSSIKPVKLLRNLFNQLERKNRGLEKPATIKVKKIAKPVIIVSPASPL